MSKYLKEKKNPLAQEVIDEIIQAFRSENETEFVAANMRNVLFCGASRSGKTTTYKVFMDPCYCPEKASLFSETTSTVFKSFSIRDVVTSNVHKFILNLIDSPGTFEIQAAESEFVPRSNEKIGDLIIDCLNREVTYLNMVAMFLTVSGRVSERDVDSVDLFMQMFGITDSDPDKRLPVVLCITHADEYNQTKRDSVSEEVKKHPRLIKYFQQNLLEILWMGCVDYRHHNYYDTQVIAEQYKNVFNWRDTFLKKIFAAERRISLTETAIYNSRQKDLKNVLKFCYDELNYLVKADPETGEYKRRQVELRGKMEYLYKNKLFLEDEKGIPSSQVEQFWSLLQKTKKEARKVELLHPWSVD